MILPLTATLAAIVLIAAGARAELVTSLAEGGDGRIEYQSVNPATTFAFLRNLNSAPRATAVGWLTLPPGTGRVPVVVLMHGSSGISPYRESGWATRLKEWGIGAFVVDSYGPRKIRETASNQAQLHVLASVADVFYALQLLATHPRVDPDRVVIMGFSRGGHVALLTALEPIRAAIMPGNLRFAAHIPFYPPCNIRFIADRTTGAPMLHLHGAIDDWTPAESCSRYMEWFRSKGTPVASIVYPNAYHAFDGTARYTFDPKWQTSKNCDADFDLRRFALATRAAPDSPLSPAAAESYVRGCATTGASIEANAPARQASTEAVRVFLARVLKMEIP